jgi:hypothetical protein
MLFYPAFILAASAKLPRPGNPTEKISLQVLLLEYLTKDYLFLNS